jgi:hypothetical protein
VAVMFDMRNNLTFERLPLGRSHRTLERMIRSDPNRCPHATSSLSLGRSPLICACTVWAWAHASSCDVQQAIDVYHGTASGLLSSILEKGLVPGGAVGSDRWANMHRRYSIVDASADKRPTSVYLVKQPILSHIYAQHAAEMNPGSRPVVVHLKLPNDIAARMKSDELDDDAHRFEGVIKAEWIAAIIKLTDI